MSIADKVFLSNAVFTGNGKLPFPGGIAVKGNKIIAVGQKDEVLSYCGVNTKKYNFGDSLIMPGICDAHGHYSMGALYDSKYFINDILYSRSEQECVGMIKSFADAHPEYDRIIGQGWFPANWNDAELPTKMSLDKIVPDRPVYLASADAHTGWLNSKALAEVGIDKNDFGYGQNIVLLPNGEPSGILRESAWFHLASNKTFIPADSISEEVNRDLMHRLARVGITTFCDVSGILPGVKYDTLEDMDKAGELTVRINLNPSIGLDMGQEEINALKKKYKSDKLRVTGLKGVIDGVTSTYTGCLLEPYSDRPDTKGFINDTAEYYEQCIINANKYGLGVRLHCIADGSVRFALDCFEKSNKVNDNNLIRNSIEHIENIHPDDIARFKRLGVTASMQPRHLALDANEKIIRLGPERCRWEWPCRSILEAGGILALGTDYPVVDFNPFETIYYSVTRHGYDRKPTGINPSEKLTMTQTLRAYTFGGAYVSNRENELGTLEVGKLADIIILDRNLFIIDEEKIPDTKVLMNIFDGNIIYEAKK